MFFRGSFCTLVFMCFGLSGMAATINSVSILDGGSGHGGCGTTAFQSVTGAGTQEINLNDGGINCTVAADAYAGGGAIGYRATATMNSFIGPAGSYIIQGGARTVMSDIYITPTFDVNDPVAIQTYGYQVGVTLNAAISGIASAATENSNDSAGAGNSIKATVTLSGTSEPGNQVFNTLDVFGGAGTSSSGPLQDFDILDQAILVSITQDWRFPMSLIFNFDTNVSVSAFGGGNILSSTLDAYSSLSFSETGPAFLLPDGFTVNAPELNIINNRWIDPRAVPEPGGLPMMLAALGSVWMLRRRSMH
jgi:hypothetical protein